MVPRVSIAVAIGKNRELGKDGRLLWHIPEDLKRFKRLTLGHPVVMGRKTFDSILQILGKPLPGRTNIVVTRDPTWSYQGESLVNTSVLRALSLEEALWSARNLDQEEIYIGGGAQMYEQSLPLVNRLYLTLVDETKEADTFFPPYEHMFTKKLSGENREHNGLKYTWVTLERE